MYEKIKFIHSKYEIDPETSEIIGKKPEDWVNWMEKDDFEDFQKGIETDKKFDVKKFYRENFIVVISVSALIFLLLVTLSVALVVLCFKKCCKGLICNRCIELDCSCCNKKTEPELEDFNLDEFLVNSGLKFEKSLPSRPITNQDRPLPSTPRTTENEYDLPDSVLDNIGDRWDALVREGKVTSPTFSESTTSLPDMVLKFENEEFRYFQRKEDETLPSLYETVPALLPRHPIQRRSMFETIYENPYENTYWQRKRDLEIKNAWKRTNLLLKSTVCLETSV